MTDEQIAKLTLPELISTTQSTKAPSGALFSMEGNNMTIITNATNTIIDLSDIQFSHLYWLFLLPAIFAAADIITGWLQATINSCWDSTKMRKGLYRKGGEMLVVFLAYIIYIALQIPIEIVKGIVIYIVIMETVSVIENLDLAGVPMPTWITHRLKKIADGLIKEDKKDEA